MMCTYSFDNSSWTPFTRLKEDTIIASNTRELHRIAPMLPKVRAIITINIDFDSIVHIFLCRPSIGVFFEFIYPRHP